MPSYNYKCNHCDHDFTAFKKVDERNTAECPKCKNIAPKSGLLQAPGIQFKGSGWFKTSGGY